MSNPLLLVVRGPEAGLRFELDAGRVRIGADPSSDIILEGEGIAPHHCAVSVEDDRFTIQLLSPASVCMLNGVHTKSAVLTDADRIRLGEIDLLFRNPSDSRPRGQSLISACSLFYLFRAMHGLDLDEQGPLESQIREIASDGLGPGTLDVFIGGEPSDWAQRLGSRNRDSITPWADLLTRALEKGSATEDSTLIQAFRFGHNLAAALLWHSPDPAAAEPPFAAMSAIASSALETANEINSLEIRTTLAESQLASRTGILGTSHATQTLLRQIEKVTPRETTILIQGESGTGKELVARASHNLSPRKARPFVALNCAAIAENLLESELFGHEKGAFTGASEQRQGKLELAAGGTVFLDEIGEMALPLQAKMLRVLQQRECERVGGRKTISLDIRVVAATNRDLAAEVKRGSFREDLFHRLNVVSLRTPPLREREDDIVLLAHAFLDRAAKQSGRPVEGFTIDALAALRRYDWPGNIRELEHAIERAVVLGDLNQIQLEDLPDSILDSHIAAPGEAPAFDRSIHDAKRGAIIDAWRNGAGDSKAAVSLLGVHPNSLLRMIRNLNCSAPDVVDSALGVNYCH